MSELVPQQPDLGTALRELELPQLAPGDTHLFDQLKEWADRDPGDRLRHRRRRNEQGHEIYFYDIDGKPMPGDISQQESIFLASRTDVTDTTYFIKTRLSFGQDEVVVHTSFLGIDHNVFGPLPLVWETMLSSTDEWSDFQWRYTTRAAALIGHDTIVDTLTEHGMTIIEGKWPGRELEQ